jgi:serine/threonine-protein kinase
MNHPKQNEDAALRDHLQRSLGSTYTLERELGGGGMARVFLAEETALGRRVVVKVLAPELAEGLSADRFAREVRLAARLQHPNILPVFAAGAADGVPFYTMPYVEGESLRARLQRAGVLAIPDAVGILRDVARALAHAHEQGIVHRDVKPDNVLLSGDAAVVADFGIAKAVDAARAESGTALTQLGAAIGTPAYMAPEQATGETDVDQRADLYAWGIVAYELLAGHHPFAGKSTAQALIVAHLTETPAPLHGARPGLSAALVSLVTRCVAKAPGDRPASARELIDVLANLSAADAARARAATPSIAVLPFVNLSADPENEYFSAGISEEILSVLAQDASLRVAARSSSFAFKGKQDDLRSIAERLHVSTLLEGSVRRAGNRVRISAQLVHASDGYQLWSDRFDRELTDIFAVQDEIATAIVTTLKRKLRETVDERAAAGVSATPQPARRTRLKVSVEAHDAYLKGLYANRHMRGVGTDAGRAHFERALALEPNFAAAHAGIAESHLWLAIFFALPLTEAFARVRRHAKRALALDPELADAHWLLGEGALWHDWDTDTAEEHIRQALAIEPHHAGALMARALCHNARCRRQEALAAAAAAVQVDPLGTGTRIWFLAIAFNVRENDLTIAEASRLIAEQPQYSEAYRWRAMARIIAGDLPRARADLETAGSLAPRHVWWETNAALLASQEGNLDEALRVRDELMRRSAQEWVSPVALAYVEQARGDYEAAFEWYERGYQARDFLMTVLHTDPQYSLVPPGKERPITDDPRWTRLVRRVGLAP